MGIAAYNRGSRAISAHLDQEALARRTVRIVRPQRRLVERVEPIIGGALVYYSRKVNAALACSRDASLPPGVRAALRQSAKDIAADCRAFWRRVRP